MAEWENPRYFDNSYSPDLEVAKLDLYRLLNQFLASKTLSELCNADGELNHAMYTLDPFFEVEATRILLSSAVIARVIDDKHKDLHQYNTKSGILIPNLNEPENTVDLNLREACNKIIHADSIRYDVEVEVQGMTQRYFNPYIYYYGSLGKKRWKATLNVVDYVKNYTDNIV
ncbi:TPA: hypothetical protein ACPVXW_004541 [Vibrio parahaemolyticus]